LATFLEINNFILEVPETEVFLTMEKLAASNLSENELATWLEKNSSQINN